MSCQLLIRSWKSYSAQDVSAQENGMTAGRTYTEEEAALLTKRFGTKENKNRVLDLKIHTSIGSILLC